jgi:hypothetical protein
MSTPPSAGWFDDPDQPDQLRYFDGVIWTAHTTARSRFGGQPAVQDNLASSTGPAQQTAPGPVGGGSLGGSVHLTLAPLITRLVAYIVDRIIVGLLTAVTGFWLILRAFDPLRDELEKASAAGDIAAILTLTDRADRSYWSARRPPRANSCWACGCKAWVAWGHSRWIPRCGEPASKPCFRR